MGNEASSSLNRGDGSPSRLHGIFSQIIQHFAAQKSSSSNYSSSSAPALKNSGSNEEGQLLMLLKEAEEILNSSTDMELMKSLLPKVDATGAGELADSLISILETSEEVKGNASRKVEIKEGHSGGASLSQPSTFSAKKAGNPQPPIMPFLFSCLRNKSIEVQKMTIRLLKRLFSVTKRNHEAGVFDHPIAAIRHAKSQYLPYEIGEQFHCWIHGNLTERSGRYLKELLLSNDQHLVRESLELLSYMSEHPGTGSILVRINILTSIVVMLQTNLHEEEIVLSALSCIANLCHAPEQLCTSQLHHDGEIFQDIWKVDVITSKTAPSTDGKGIVTTTGSKTLLCCRVCAHSCWKHHNPRYQARMTARCQCAGARDQGLCSHSANATGFLLNEQNLIPKLLQIYGDPSLSPRVYEKLTQVILNLCLCFFDPSQTCKAHHCYHRQKTFQSRAEEAKPGNTIGSNILDPSVLQVKILKLIPRNLLDSFLEGHIDISNSIGEKQDHRRGEEKGDKEWEEGEGNEEGEENEEEEEEDLYARDELKNTEKKDYADMFPHLLDDPNRWFHLVVICVPVVTQAVTSENLMTESSAVAVSSGSNQLNVDAAAKLTRKQYGMDSHKKLSEVRSEIKFYIDGKQVFTTITTRRPMSYLRVVGNCMDGTEPWGPIADFRLYDRAFSMKGSAFWPASLCAAPPLYPKVPGRQLELGSIDHVRLWMTKQPEVFSGLVMLLGDRNPLLLEQACGVLANLALFSPSIPFILRQTVSVNDVDDESQGKKMQNQFKTLRQQEEDLLLEEIRLRKRMRARNSGIVPVASVVSETTGNDNTGLASGHKTGGATAEADRLLLSEIDRRREIITQRIQDLAFELEFSQTNKRLPLGSVLANLITLNDKPDDEKSVSKQAQRLLLNLR